MLTFYLEQFTEREVENGANIAFGRRGTKLKFQHPSGLLKAMKGGGNGEDSSDNEQK